MKKTIAIFLLACMLLGVLASCATDSTESSSEMAQSSESEKVQEQSSTLDTQESPGEPSSETTSNESSSSEESSSALDEPVEKELDDSVVNLTADMMEEIDFIKILDQRFISSQMKLSLDLFKAFAKKSENENVFISPLSVQMALAMNANGACGQTRAEMEALLADNITLEELNNYLASYRQSLPSSEGATLKIANSIWFKSSDSFVVKSEFLEKNQRYFRAELYRAKFDDTTVNSINAWVDKNTDSMIKEILKEIPQEAVMYLINAIMFDAKWERPFNENCNYDGEFTNISGNKKQVEMMYRDGEYMYIETDSATGFKKNYEGGAYSFVALLPGEAVSINDYIASLDAQTLLDTLGSVKHGGEGIIQVPKFEHEYSLEMNELLSELGMPTAFLQGSADFGNISNESLYISQVVHKTFISLDNLGTRAGAVTMVEDSAESESKIYWSVTLDRPFVYMIVDNATNLPVFIGAVMDI
ncbi:MAG: serpin family protein [Clostridia bacterium]|nr:serpin family protein [Clostridia bacterium]